MRVRRLVAAAALLLATLSGAVGRGAERPHLVPLVEPPLDDVSEAVREQLAEQRRVVTRALAVPNRDEGELASAFGRLGQLYLLYAFEDAARSAFENAHRLAPEEFRWIYYRGIAELRLGDLERAAASFGRALELEPDHPTTLFRLGRIALHRDRLDEAASWFERGLESGDDSIWPLYGLAQVALQRGETQRAIEFFERVLERRPEAGEVHYQIGLAYRQIGEIEKARDHLSRREEGSLELSDPLLEELGAIATGAGVHIMRGDEALAAEDFEAAIEHYGRAVELDPDNVKAWRLLATALGRGGRGDEALRIFERVIEEDPDDPMPHRHLGRLLAERGEYESALEHLRRAVELGPDSADARVELAQALEWLGRTQEALEMATEAVELEPENVRAGRLRATLLARSGRIEEAEESLRRLLELRPDEPESLLALAEVLEERGEADGAIERYRRVASSGEAPASLRARALAGAAGVLEERGRREVAIEELRRAVALSPDSPALHLELATTLGRAERYEEAAASYRRAIDLGADDADARYGEATALLLAGREAEAARRLEEAVTRFPEHVALRHLLARVLATARDGEVRDGDRALRLATDVLQQAATIDHAETVAMAQAEIGRFEEAAAWQRRIIGRAQAIGESQRVPLLQDRLSSYLERRPVRAPWLARGGAAPDSRRSDSRR